MAKWRKEGIFLRPLFNMKCKGCRTPYATFSEDGYALSNFPINSDKPDEYESYVIDRTYSCDLCGYRVVHGIAISKEHFLEIVKWTDEHGGVAGAGKLDVH